MRINKYIASCGVTSRRKADELIAGGKVSVNGKIVDELGYKINPKTDKVIVDGVSIKLPKKHVYYALNKPKGVISAVSDDKGRKTVVDLIDTKERIFPIGRLDYDTEGLLLLTNDGELANKLMHPSSEIGKTYIAKVRGDIVESELATLRKGVMLNGKKTAPAKVRKLKFEKGISRIEITIHEGRNRQIRRMFEALNKDVTFLKRVAIGEIRLGGMSRYEVRHLTDGEINYLKKA